MIPPSADRSILSHLQRDPILAGLINRYGSPTLRAEVEPDRFFRHLVDAIISQQISVKAAAAIVRRIESDLLHGGITPESVQAAGPDRLRALGISRQKALYLTDLAHRVLAGALILGRLPEMDDEAVIEALRTVKGIGRWTAQMFLIFSLGRPDILPVDDLGFRTALRRQYGLPALPGPAETERLSEPWRPYRTYGAWYLWKSLNNAPLSSRRTLSAE